MRALLIHPEFRSSSFWNYRETCSLLDARYPAAPLGLCTVAALLPADWELRLVDRNVEHLDDETIAWADLVLTGGMMPQQLDCLDLIRRARAMGKTVVVGGPDPTSSPHLYKEADHLVLGEGEVTVPQFVADLQRGQARKVYQDGAKADMSLSPTPRFDLLRFSLYNHVGIQFCRGCPFNCEFCDIIELYGRKPRAKTPEQILRELETLHALGYRGHIDLVDDNFIGNKKLVKELLPRVKTWLEERDWPFEFSTEASINLADDPVLLGMMRDVGFFAIFVGIESPDEKTLTAMQKRQNTRRSIVDSIQKIYEHGIFVNAGFIIGFDSEQGHVARGLIDCVEQTAIPRAWRGCSTRCRTRSCRGGSRRRAGSTSTTTCSRTARATSAPPESTSCRAGLGRRSCATTWRSWRPSTRPRPTSGVCSGWGGSSTRGSAATSRPWCASSRSSEASYGW
jgi:radical SAM superfamily enzyme YgiQ (UPF0313 family)